MRRWLGLVLLTLLAACTGADDGPPPTVARLPAEIRTLEAWQSEQGSLNEPDESNEWQFFGREGQTIRLRAVAQGSPVTMRLTLRGVLLAEGDTIEMALPEDEVYRITVRLLEGSSSTYDIGLSYPGQANPNAATAVPKVVGVPTPTPAYAAPGDFIMRLDMPQEVGGLLTAESPQHVYTLEGTAGEVITLEMSRVAGTLDPTLTLYDPQGNALAMDDNSAGDGNARLLNIRLPADGLYSIQAHGAGFYGDYTLRYSLGPQPVMPDEQPTPIPTEVAPYVVPTVGPVAQDQRLVNHVAAIGNLAREGDFQRFSFLANAGDVLSISVRPYQDSPLRPRFEVFDPNGALLTTADSATSGAGGAALAIGVPVAANGAYLILVTGEDNSSGPFLIGVGKGASAVDVYQGQVESNIRATGTIQRRGERHSWQITLHPGDVITAAASPTGRDFDPVLELATAEGIVLYRDDNSGANNAALIDLATITEPASYVLRVYDARGDRQGSYTLLWRYVNAAPSPTPIAAAATILAVDDTVQEGQYQFYVFQGQAGQQVRIQVLAAPGSALDPVAVLLDPQGQVIAEDDDSNGTLNPSFTVTLPQDGTYSVRVNGYLSGGRFDLFVAVLI